STSPPANTNKEPSICKEYQEKMKEMEKIFKQMKKLIDTTGENIKELTQSVNDIKRKQELRKKAASQSTSSSSSTKEPTTDAGSKKTNKRIHKSDSSEDSSI